MKGNPGLSAVTLMKEWTHPSTTDQVSIPVKNGAFSYDLASDFPMYYILIPGTDVGSFSYDGAFFSENGDVNIDVTYTTPGEKPEISLRTVMPLTDSYNDFKKRMYEESGYNRWVALDDSLQTNGLAYTPEVTALQEAMKTADEQQKDAIRAKADSIFRTGNAYSDLYKESEELYSRVDGEMKRLTFDYAATDLSYGGLFTIFSRLMFRNDTDKKAYADLYEKKYKESLGWHPYSRQIERLIPVLRDEVGKPGMPYPDVEARDSLGTMRRLSEFIGGKVAVIDLWASWCGPCRRHSKELISVYEKYAPKGLAMVGIAREHGDDSAHRKAVAQDGYPWPSLVELNDENLIWASFGTPTAPGRIVLVGADGKIIEIDPSPQRISELLDKLLD